MAKKWLNPQFAEWLDLMQTPSAGFRSEFFKFRAEEVDPFIAAAATRIHYAVKDAIGRLGKLSEDLSKNDPQKHDASRLVYENLAKHVAGDVKAIRDRASKDAEEARNRAFSTIAADPDRAAIYAETRQVFRERAASGDANWPAEATRLVKSDRHIAAAINQASGLNSGMTEERRMDLVLSAVKHFAPDDVTAMLHASDVSAEADRLDAGMAKLKAAAYSKAMSDKLRASVVDPNAKFAEPPAEAVE